MRNSVQARFRAMCSTGLAAVALAIASLANAAPAASNIPASESPFPAAQTTLVWIGTGSASVQVNGAWQRYPPTTTSSR